MFASEVKSQTRDELRKRKEQTEQKIKLSNELLEKTERSKSLGFNKLLIISKRINLREQLIQEFSIDQAEFSELPGSAKFSRIRRQ